MKIDKLSSTFFLSLTYRFRVKIHVLEIGLQRNTIRGVFVWNSDNSKVDYVNWDDNEPNGAGDCVQLCGEHDFMWEDNDCASPEEFALCQLSNN